MAKKRVRDVMTEDVISVRTSTPYKDVARVLLDNAISAVPVVDEGRRVEGVVSEADLIEKESYQAGGHHELENMLTRRSHGTRTKANATSAQALMTRPVITVGPDASIAHAAQLTHKNRITLLPVVVRDGLLVGIVSRSDLLTPFLRPDSDLRDEVMTQVLDGRTSAPKPVEAAVRDGVVTLTGSVENQFVARDAVRVASAVDGVVDVIDRLEPRVRLHEQQPGRLPFSVPYTR
jgi:CBS-domain-containing membrane protein